MKFGLEQQIIDTFIEVFEANSKVDKAYMFGSRAKGNYRPDSDIDIAIKGKDLNTGDIIAMSVAFETKGISDKIDLINYDSIKEPALKDHIDRVGIEFFSIWQETKIGKIPSSWKLMTLDEIKSKEKKAIISGPFGSNISSKYFVPKGVPVIRGNNLSLGLGKKFKDDGFVFITEEKANELGTWAVKEDIIFTAVGTIGQVGILLGNEKYRKYIISNKQLRLTVDKSIVSPLFAYYWFASPAMIDTIEQRNTGSSVPLINLSVLKSLNIPIPQKWEQELIVQILGSLDDKIDLLHRQNKTLEQLAETLFRNYFPMTSDENNFVELGNYVECINGVSYKSSELNPSKVGMVSLKSFDRNGGFSIEGFKEFTGKYKEKQVVVEGDLIVAHTDITQDAEVIGNPALIISNPNFDTMIISMDIVKVISKVDWISNEFLYILMKTREFKSHCEGCANGSTVLHLNKQAIPTFEFPVPDKTKISDFTKQAKDLVNKTFLNHRQIRNLVKTRDTLLPKFMSGEIRVILKNLD